MASSGYAAILARLQASELREHCDEALRLELIQVQHRLHDMRVAVQRLRSVGSAARALGNEDLPPSHSQNTLLQGLQESNTDLARAMNQFGMPVEPREREAEPSVCCKCQNTREKTESEPLLTKPDAAALSPPRRAKPTAKRTLMKPTQTRRKLVVPRRRSPTPDPEPETEQSPEPETPKKDETPKPVETPKKPEKPPIADDVEVQVIEDDDDEDEEDGVKEEGDIRVRLLQRIDACWPLATSLGALEMRQRRAADYADLVTRVCALFRVLFDCDSEEMASRSMRSVLVKARDSLAVAVSLLSLHDVTNTNAPMILALVRAVDAASSKHANLQKHIAPFRDSLAELEVALLTRTVRTPPTTTPTTKKRKHRAGK